MQIKTTVRYQFLCVRLDTINRTLTMSCVDKDAAHAEPAGRYAGQ